MEKFSLQHIVLYSKGWYKSSNNIWKDLEKLIEMDGYLGCLEGDSDLQKQNRIAYLIVGQLQRIPLKGHLNSLQSFYEGIKDYNCWKFGYYTKTNTFSKDTDHLPNYDFNEAVVRYCLSAFSSLSKDEWDVTKPDFKAYPRKNREVEAKVKEIFG